MALTVSIIGCSEPGSEHEQRGDQANEKQEYRAAIASYSAAIRDASDMGRYYSKRGEAYVAVKDYEAALADFDRYKELSGDDSNFLQLRAIVLLRLGRYDDAIQQLTDCIETDPCSDNYRLRGSAFMEMLRCSQAVDDFDQVLRLNPLDSAALLMRGQACLRLKWNDKAEADFSRAIEIEPDLASAYWSRAQARQRMGKLELGTQDRAQALALDPSLDFTNTAVGRDFVRDLGAPNGSGELLLDVPK